MQVLNKLINLKYDIIKRYECGIELKGTEVKSIKDAMCSIKESFALIKDNEIYVKNMHISPYDKGNINNVNEIRDRKLLLHKDEILNLQLEIKKGGFALVPSKIYLKKNLVKVELCLCKGKKIYDNREKINQSLVKRQINEYKK